MNGSRYPQILRIACFLALAALALMVWSLLDPRPIPVVVAMSVGQVLGTLSLGAFLVVVIADLRRRMEPVIATASAGDSIEDPIKKER
ncbi:MAG: hypothetical protein ABI321_13235 [Polyangia bacterium]